VVCEELHAEFTCEVGHPDGDAVHAALRVVDAEVEVDVAHEVVQRGRGVGRPAEEHQGVLHHLLELRVVEVVLDVVLHRPEERQAAGVLGEARVEPVPDSGPVDFDEVLHPDLVVLLRLREVVVEHVARPWFVGVEDLLDLLAVRRHVDGVAVRVDVQAGNVAAGTAPLVVLEEDAVVRVEVRQLVVVAGLFPEVREELLEDVRHQVPRGPHVEPEAVAFEDACATADLLVLLDDGHVGTRVGEVARGRQPAEARTDYGDRRPREFVHVSHEGRTADKTTPSGVTGGRNRPRAGPRGPRRRRTSGRPPRRR
jgi:hypothetical protein